jgi:hypothetical protein
MGVGVGLSRFSPFTSAVFRILCFSF